MENRKGLGKFLYESTIFDSQSNNPLFEIKNTLFEKLKKILDQEKKCAEFTKNIEIRSVSLLFSSITQMFTEYPHEKEKNIKFLLRLKSVLLT